jgi:hypothetical protein
MLKTRLSSTADLTQFRNTAVKSSGVQVKAASKKDVTANWITPSGGTPMSTAVFGAPSYNTLLTGIIPEYNEQFLLQYYRDMYYMDPIAGSAVDMSSSFPFSDFTLAGLENKELDLFGENLSRINIRSLMQEISNAYLVDGAFIGTMIYNAEAKVFQDVMLHDVANASISPQPFHSLDPVVKMNSASQLSQFMNAGSPYLDRLMESYPRALIDTYAAGTAVLDPLTTIYIPRKALRDRTHVSYLKRLLPFYLFEKVMFRGTLVEAHKRQRSTSHIMAGNENWIPSDGELATMLAEFQRTELDTLGAWIITRDGVQVNEIRPGGDFWKWTDVAEQLVPMKLRGLGISEAFLSGDASYACLAGNTLIPTTKGLVRIDSLGSGKEFKRAFSINADMDSRFGKAKAVAWVYNGYQETLRVTAATGNCVQATGNHPLLVLDGGKTTWKRADEIKVGDLLCISRNKVTRKTPLKLNVPLPVPRKPRAYDATKTNKLGNRVGMSPGSRVDFKPGHMTVPTHMTPELAYWLALFISEGNVAFTDSYSDEPGLAQQLFFSNSDPELVNRFVFLAKDIFDVDFREITEKSASQINAEPARRIRTNRSILSTGVRNRALIDWLRDIGVYVKPGRVNGKTPSYFKQVPWSVLQADEESQKAFLAGYAECDGSLARGTSWISVSCTLIQQLQAMLNSHGYQPTTQNAGTVLSLSREDSEDFWSTAHVYLSIKSSHAAGGKYSKNDGLPCTYWTSFIEERRLKFDRHGAYFLSDTGEVVCHSCNDKSWGFNTKELRRFNYKFYAEGKYDNFLEFLKKLSLVKYRELTSLLKYQYRYSEVVSVIAAGKEHVYDISMKPGTEPAFVANGLVVHNTAEAAITVFMENMEAYRQLITYKVFTSKFFPLIAVLNNQYKDVKKARKISSPSDIFHNLQNSRNLRIPSVQWHKSLTGKDEESTWDMLEKMSEKGFVIPLKMWAGAAGQDIATILRELKEDRRIREAIEDITGKKAEAIGNSSEGEFDENSFDEAALQQGIQNEGGEGQEEPNPQETARFMQARRDMADLPIRTTSMHRRVPLLDRDFGNIPSDTRLSKTGKVHASFTPGRDSRKANDHIIKAMRALADPEYKAKKIKEVREKMGASADMGISTEPQDPRKTRRFSMD